MMKIKKTLPLPSEGESNTSKYRSEWETKTHNSETRAILDDDALYFMRQSVSSPCLSVVAKAEGAYIEDTNGQRYLDFHGNNVHHIGYGHPVAAAERATKARRSLGVGFIGLAHYLQTHFHLLQKF